MTRMNVRPSSPSLTFEMHGNSWHLIIASSLPSSGWGGVVLACYISHIRREGQEPHLTQKLAELRGGVERSSFM